MSKCLGSPSCPRVMLPAWPPRPPFWQHQGGQDKEAGRPCSSRAGAWPAVLPGGLLPCSESITSSGSHSGKGAAEPLGVEGRGAFQGPSWQPPVPDEARRHASGCLPAERLLGGQLAFVSFLG